MPWIADNSVCAGASTCFDTHMKTPLRSRRARTRALTFALLASPSLALLPVAAHADTLSCAATYTVRPGDSLWSIGRACGVSPATIRNLNTLGRYLLPGQVLRLSAYAPGSDSATSTMATGTVNSAYGPDAYVVRPGDALERIAQRLGASPAALAAANGLSNVNLIRVGQVLHWPVTGVYQSVAAPASATTAYQPATSGSYLVRPGDTLSGIALNRNLSLDALASANGITNGRLLRAGTILRLPNVGATIASSVPGASVTPSTAPQASAPSAATTTVLSSGIYNVKPGDTLSGIALALGLTPNGLAQSNGLSLGTPIQPGQALRYAVVLYNGPSQAEVGAVLDQQAAEVGVEDAFLRAIAWRESNWRMVDAADGGIGVMQLMPDTVTWLKSTYVPGAWDPHNLIDNVHAGAVLLLVYSQLYGGDLTKAATAYHGGMGVVGQTPTAEMTHYTSTVAAFRQSFIAGLLP